MSQAQSCGMTIFVYIHLYAYIICNTDVCAYLWLSTVEIAVHICGEALYTVDYPAFYKISLISVGGLLDIQ